MASPNYSFTTLTGSETAGYSSINALITSIDTQLNKRIPNKDTSGTGAYDGMIPVYSNAASSGFTQSFVDTANIAPSAITEAKIASGAVTNAKIGTDAVTLGTQTTGSYVASISAGGSSEIVTTGTGEGAAATVRLADNTALRGAATVATPPTYTNGSIGTVGRVPDAKYVTDALAYATAGNITLTGDVTLSSGVATIQPTVITEGKIATNAISQVKMADNSVGTAEIIDSNVTYAKLGDDVKYYQTAVVVTTSGASARTFGLTDSNRKFIEYNVATTGGTFTVPPSNTTNFPIGAEIHLLQTNTGQLTVAAGAGVTINATPGLKLRTQWSSATLIKRASDTWILVGDLVA